VKTTASACEYCPHGSFPDGDNIACDVFKDGSFDAVPDLNNRVCYTRSQYKNFACPMQLSGGWGSDGRPSQTSAEKFLDLSAAENRACSQLHCMGAFYELAVIAKRQSGQCRPDESLKSLCRWSTARLNEDIAQREGEARRAEEASELSQRQDKCRNVCDCNQLCQDVTDDEQRREQAFTVVPFTQTACAVRGLACFATCTSTRPVKTVERRFDCMSNGEVRDIVVKKTKLPRCQASCSTCPQEPYRDSSFSSCDGKGEGLSGGEIAGIVVGSIVGAGSLVGLAWWCSRHSHPKRRVTEENA